MLHYRHDFAHTCRTPVVRHKARHSPWKEEDPAPLRYTQLIVGRFGPGMQDRQFVAALHEAS